MKERGMELARYAMTATEVILFISLCLAAFTQSEKQYIKERDKEFGIQKNKGGCQMPIDHPCNGDKAVQVHHMIPQRYAKEFGIDPDFVENGITLCEYAHSHFIHPDMQTAKHDYHMDKQSYQKTFQARAETLRDKKPYWDTQFDRLLHTIVIRSEQRARKAGKPRPGEEGFIPPERHDGRTTHTTT